MSAYVKFWKEMDERAAKSKAEVAETRAIIESLLPVGGKWRFVRVEQGIRWIARHSLHGEVRAPTSKALIAEAKRINEAEQARREKKA